MVAFMVLFTLPLTLAAERCGSLAAEGEAEEFPAITEGC